MTAQLFDLTGKVAVVTGATRGLGHSIVLGLARAGADVVVTSRSQGDCDDVAAEITESTGRKAVAIAGDVGTWSGADHLAAQVFEQFSVVDVLVNNAGLWLPAYPPKNFTEESFDQIVGVNLKGPWRLCALFGDRMLQAGGGSIVNVTSSGAQRPDAHYAPYAAAKAGLEAITRGLAPAFGPSVRINCVMPGNFVTEMLASTGSLEDYERFARRSFALRRSGRSDEMVGPVLFLASDASSYVTGAVVAVNGGLPSGFGLPESARPQI